MIATFKTAGFVANMKAALLAVSQDPAREHQQCIRIELAQGVARFVATNGHWLWLNDAHFFEVTGVDSNGKKLFGASSAVVHISRPDATRILRELEKGKKAATWDVELDTDGKIRQIGREITFTPAEVRFSPYQQIIPSHVPDKPRAHQSFDPHYIAAISEAFALVSSSPNVCGIEIRPAGGELDQAVVTSDTSTALVVLMPRRANKVDVNGTLGRYRAPATKAA